MKETKNFFLPYFGVKFLMPNKKRRRQGRESLLPHLCYSILQPSPKFMAKCEWEEFITRFLVSQDNISKRDCSQIDLLLFRKKRHVILLPKSLKSHKNFAKKLSSDEFLMTGIFSAAKGKVLCFRRQNGIQRKLFLCLTSIFFRPNSQLRKKKKENCYVNLIYFLRI